MREIKFRAWDKKEKVMRTVSLLNTSYMGTEYQTIYFESGPYRHLSEIELMQYTGLKDKNGVEIYEGDIIRLSDALEPNIETVCFEDGAFRASVHHEIFDTLQSYEVEVIGNIYKNPELAEDL
jgi:uncharacterized phage protein (TIGR01671 family)